MSRQNDERWREWQRVRSMPMARQAAEDGYSWSMKCAVLNDGKRAEQIDMAELADAHRHAGRLAAELDKSDSAWDRFQNKQVTFTGHVRVMALKMARTLLIREAETQAEIARYGRPAPE